MIDQVLLAAASLALWGFGGPIGQTVLRGPRYLLPAGMGLLNLAQVLTLIALFSVLVSGFLFQEIPWWFGPLAVVVIGPFGGNLTKKALENGRLLLIWLSALVGILLTTVAYVRLLGLIPQ